MSTTTRTPLEEQTASLKERALAGGRINQLPFTTDTEDCLENHLAITCPLCAHNYVHFEHPTYYNGDDDYKTQSGVRGDLILIPFWGECGHVFNVCVGYHKGNSYIFTQVLSTD